MFVRDAGDGDSTVADGLPAQLGAVVERVRRYPLAELRRGLTFRYDVAANWKVIAENYNECYHCGPVHPELCQLVPAFRRGGAGLDWPDGIPHRDGAWTLTMDGTSTRRPFDGLDEQERTRHKGELIYPNLLLSLCAEHVAAFTLVPHGPSQTTVVCELLFHPDEFASPSFDPSDAGDLWDLVNRQDWAICERVQRGMSSRGWTGGWFAPMEDESADITRWYRRLMGGAPFGRRCVRVRVRSRRARRPRRGDGLLAGAAVAVGGRLRAVRARPRARGVARPLAHHPALVPHARLRAARPLRPTTRGRRSKARPERSSSPSPAGSTCSHPAAAIDPQPYRRSLDEVGVPYEWIDGGEVRRRWPAFARGTVVTDDVMAIFSPTSGIVPAQRATAVLHDLARERGAQLRQNIAVRELRPTGGEVDVVTDQGTVRCGCVVVCADAWTNRLLEPLGHRVELTVTLEQVSYFATPELDDLRPGRFPVWIWMDDPSFYGFPEFGVARCVQGGRGLRRLAGRSRRPILRCRPDRRGASRRVRRRTGRRSPGIGEHDDVPVHAHRRTATSWSTGCPDVPQVCVGLGAAHGFKFAAWFGRELAALASGAAPGPHLAPFSITREALRRPADRAAWLVLSRVGVVAAQPRTAHASR